MTNFNTFHKENHKPGWPHLQILPNMWGRINKNEILFQKIGEEETLSNSFYEACIIIILKPRKGIIRKETTGKCLL